MKNMIRAEEIARKVRSQRFLANEDCYKLIELAGMKKELEEICELIVLVECNVINKILTLS